MKRFNSYKHRCLLLGTVALLLCAFFWSKRLGPSIAQWRAASSLSEQLSAGQDEAAQIAALETEFQQLNTALGDLGTPADQAWQAVLDELAKGGSTGVQLHVIETEITSELDGNRLHVLPITLRGPFAGLLRTANRLHRTVPEARPVSIRFHTERAGYGGQRALLMTLYLQKIVDENA